MHTKVLPAQGTLPLELAWPCQGAQGCSLRSLHPEAGGALPALASAHHGPGCAPLLFHCQEPGTEAILLHALPHKAQVQFFPLPE